MTDQLSNPPHAQPPALASDEIKQLVDFFSLLFEWDQKEKTKKERNND